MTIWISSKDGEPLPSAPDRLDEALESRDTEEVLGRTFKNYSKKGGHTGAAARTRFNRTALYKIISSDGNPTVGTLFSLLAYLGLRLPVQPLDVDGQSLSLRLRKEVH